MFSFITVHFLAELGSLLAEPFLFLADHRFNLAGPGSFLVETSSFWLKAVYF
jgi:hypothetical protein